MATYQTLEVEGIAFCVLHEGNKDDPLVALSHALMSNMHIWDSTVKALHEAGYSTLRYDHIGHGGTNLPLTGQMYRFDDFTRHIYELTKMVLPANKTPYGLIGCSMGGVLVLRYAMLYPGNARKIIACESPGMTSLDVSKPKWAARREQFRNEGVENLAKATVERWFPDPCDPQTRVKALDLTRTCTLAGYEICSTAITQYDYFSELSRIKDEDVLVLAGENDEAIGPLEIQHDMVARIRGAKFVEMKNVGHIPPMHDPVEYERIVLDFLKKEK